MYFFQCPLFSFVFIFRLRVFNASKNRLTHIPPLNQSEDLNKVQELYLSGNQLQSDALRTACGYPRLKVLHMANNEIEHIDDQCVFLSYSLYI